MRVSLGLATVASAAGSGVGPTFMRTVFVEYEDGDSQSHFNFGHAIGEAMGDVIRNAWADDAQLTSMEEWVQTAAGQRTFDGLVAASNRSFPLYTREVEGLAAGAKLPLRRVLVNQLREELAQWTSSKREGHCTDAYVTGTGTTALGHNDDWTVDWRKNSYFVVATALDAQGRVKLRFGTWVYPGYLPGEQLNWNSHGLVWTANSLFPRNFSNDGVGTAWVARDMLGARSLSDLVARAANARVSTALNYNVGVLSDLTLWNLEVASAGVHALYQVKEPYVHTNRFKLLNTTQFPGPSSEARERRWRELRPGSVDGIRGFLSDRSNVHWPVWRNNTGGDGCWTQITGIFNLQARTLSVWTSPAALSPAEMELSLDFPKSQSATTYM